MMHCPLCRNAAHTRSSRYLSERTKERYHQCQNINCSCTFATHETVDRIIVEPGKKFRHHLIQTEAIRVHYGYK